MRDKVHVHVWGNWLMAVGRHTEHIEWEKGMVVGDLVPEDKRGAKGLTLYLNRGTAKRSTKVFPGDHVDIAIRPSDPVTGWFLGLDIISQIVVGFTAIFAINKIIAAIIGRPKGPKERGDEQSSHAAWSGVRNVRVEGHPRQIVYGQFRVAPMIIDEFIQTRPSPPTSHLYTLGAIGEGPVYQIGSQTFDNAVDTPLKARDTTTPITTGVEVNGNNLDNFRYAELHVRMGRNEQDPIPGFEQVSTGYSVGATLNQAETTAAGGNLTLNTKLDLSVVPYNSDSAGAQSVWDLYGFSFDMKATADLFTALVEFPQGLYSIDGSGGLINAGFRLLMRYIELDQLGDPIEEGGDNGDGWVYVFPEPMMTAATQTPFGKEYSANFLDPQKYVAGGLGRACFFDGSDDYATTNTSGSDTIPNIPSNWAAGQDPDGITLTGWVQFNGLPASGGSAFRPLVEISDPASPGRGIGFFVSRKSIDLGGTTQERWVPVLYLGSDVGTNQHFHTGGTIYIPSTSSTTGWHHLAATYKKISATTARMAVYLDAVLAFSETYTGGAMQAAGKALEMCRSRTYQAGSYSNVQMDEWKVYNREFTPADVALDYDGGVGLYGSPESNLVAGWHFEEGLGITTAQDYGTFAGLSSQNDLRLFLGAGDGAAGTGHVHPPGTGPSKRSRYRIELLRLNLKSSSSLVQDESSWTLLYGKLDEVLAYPTLALLATRIKANDQLQGAQPTITVLTKGMLCPIWDGLSTTNPHVVNTWTKNPAWICLDIATNSRYGHGGEYDLTTVDLVSLKEWADYCDELIYDNRGSRQGIHESDSNFPVFDLRYISTLFNNFGGIEIHFRTTPSVVQPPRRWVVGRHVGFTGIPFPASGISVNINTSNIKGFEIGAVNFSSNWQVVVRYDKATYGHPWTDGAFLSAVLSPALTGTVEGREPRFEYSWVHDTFKSFWDTLIDVAATARATPMRDGRILRFRVEKPRTPVALIGIGNIKPDSFEVGYVGQGSRVNSFQADFWDEDKNYERSNTSLDDPDLEGSANEDEITRESITVEGITRRSQMKRDLYFRLKAHKLLAREGKFQTGLEALPYEVGDVLQVSHDLVPWGKSGRLLSGNTTSEIKLDRSVTLAPGVTYFLRVITLGQALAADSTVIGKYETSQVNEAAGTYSAGTALTMTTPFTFTPRKDDSYCLFSQSEEFLVQIVGASLGENFEREIEWVEYDANVYDVDDLPEDLKEE